MKIGDVLTYCGRAYYLRGVEPMSVPDRRADLEDVDTGDVVRVSIQELESRFDGERRS